MFYLYMFFPGATALDSLSAGYRTVLIDDCCRGVDLQDIETTKEGMLSNHGVIVQSKEVTKLKMKIHQTPPLYLLYVSCYPISLSLSV